MHDFYKSKLSEFKHDQKISKGVNLIQDKNEKLRNKIKQLKQTNNCLTQELYNEKKINKELIPELEEIIKKLRESEK